MSKNVFTGTMPALMTPCRADRTPDYDALVKKGKEMIAAGMSAVVYCGSMGDWPLLSDEERMTGVERLVEAGVPVVVGTGAINSKSAVAHAAHAQKVGAVGLMVIPRVLSPWSVGCGTGQPLQGNPFSSTGRTGHHLQQPGLWLCHQGGSVFCPTCGTPQPDRLQGVRRQG